MRERLWGNPSDTQVAWAAGFFEGEGSITIRKRNDTGKTQVQLSLPNTDKTMMVQFHRFIGHRGSVSGPFQPRNLTWKRRWTWYAYGLDAREVLILFMPYLSTRRKTRADRALDILDAKDRADAEAP